MKINLIGVPMDLGAGRRGVDMGPSAIRIAGISEKLKLLGHTVNDLGDIVTKNPEQQKIKNQKLKYLSEISRSCKILSGKVEKSLATNNFPLVLGGDHSIAMGTISGVSKFCESKKKTFGVLWVDAHGDLNTAETSPSGNIHGMPLAASLGIGADELITSIGNFKKVNPKNIVMIAIRELDEGEKKLLKQCKIKVFTIEDIDKIGIGQVMKQTLKKLKKVNHLHVSFDMDSIDPAIAPGVGTPVKGGIDYREAHLIMETLFENKRMQSLEIVETNPILDEKNKSAELAVELVQSAFGKRIL